MTDRLPRDTEVRWRRAQTTLWRHTLDGVVVLPVEHPAPLSLHGPAAGIWELLADSLTFAELMDVLSTTYAVDGSVAGDEVRTALDALVDAGALCRH